MIEIERKFLVKSDGYRYEAHKQDSIKQGYLNSHPERTVRVRKKGDKAFITIKGKSNEAGTIRLEWEKEISVVDAELLIPLCEKGVIDKMRYEVEVGSHVYEVDEFFGENEGLVIAEIELGAEDEAFIKPSWLGAEVTGDKKYYNSYLSGNPYKSWKPSEQP